MRNAVTVAMILIVALVSLSQAATDTILVTVREGETSREFLERVGVSREVLISANIGKVFCPGVVLKVPVLAGVDISQADDTLGAEAPVPGSNVHRRPAEIFSEAESPDSFEESIAQLIALMDLLRASSQGVTETVVVTRVDTVVKYAYGLASEKGFFDQLFSKAKSVVARARAGTTAPMVFVGCLVLAGLIIIRKVREIPGRKSGPPPSAPLSESPSLLTAIPSSGNSTTENPAVQLFSAGIPDFGIPPTVPADVDEEKRALLEKTFTSTKGLPGRRNWEVDVRDGVFIFRLTDDGGTDHEVEMILPDGIEGQVDPLKMRFRCPHCAEESPTPPLIKNLLRHLLAHHPEVLSPKPELVEG